MKKSKIFETLRPLGISLRFVQRTIKRYIETGQVHDRPGKGKPRTVRTPESINAVRARIRRNPLRKQKVMAREMKTSKRSMSRIIKSDLKMGGHLLTERLKLMRRVRSKRLLKMYAKNRYT